MPLPTTLNSPKKDPLKELIPEKNKDTEDTVPLDIDHLNANADESELARLTRLKDALQRENETLKEHISIRGKEFDSLASIQRTQQDLLRLNTINPAILQHIWDMAYKAALSTIFRHELSYWNSKASLLKNAFQLAVIRADEALENFLIARQVSPDPVARAISQINKDPLKKV